MTGGVRRDVFEKIRALKPAFIRWPGGNVAQDYRWMWGIGPRDERVTWSNLSWKNEPEPGDFGTDEFVAFARAVGAEPSITVNVEGRGATVEEAAAWVEYCNGPATSKYGAMRAANGHPAPFNVRFGKSEMRSGATGCVVTQTPRLTRATTTATRRRCAPSILRSN